MREKILPGRLVCVLMLFGSAAETNAILLFWEKRDRLPLMGSANERIELHWEVGILCLLLHVSNDDMGLNMKSLAEQSGDCAEGVLAPTTIMQRLTTHAGSFFSNFWSGRSEQSRWGSILCMFVIDPVYVCCRSCICFSSILCMFLVEPSSWDEVCLSLEVKKERKMVAMDGGCSRSQTERNINISVPHFPLVQLENVRCSMFNV